MQIKEKANLSQMSVTLGQCGPEKGQRLLLRTGKVLGTPDTPEEVGLSWSIHFSVANVGK